MPTINTATTMSPVTGAPGKGPVSLLAPGEPGVDFQSLLGVTTPVAAPLAAPMPLDAPIADRTVRQPVAADGTPLPPEAIVTTKAANPPQEVMPAVANPPAAVAIVVAAAIAIAPQPTPPADEPAPPAPAVIVPSLAAMPLPTRQQSIVSTKRAPHDREPGRPGETDDADAQTDPTALPPATPPVPIARPALAAALTVKASPLPAISVARLAPAAPPVIAAASPQIRRDRRWEGAAPLVTPLTGQPVAPTPQAIPTMAAPPPVVPQAVAATPGRPPVTDVVSVTIAQAPVSSPTDRSASLAAQGAPPPVAPIPLAIPAAPPAIVVGPALQVFGAAISAAARHEREEGDPSLSLGSVAPLAVPLAAPLAGVVAAPRQPTLDMRQERWPQAMIAHIESLRDTADAGDTRIRLIPDALGTIDVAVTRDRDTLHVQFTAEQATTRTLIQDAQPRLAALAEERGLRLGQTVVDAGAAGATSQQPQQSQQQRQPQRDAALPAAPRSARSNDDQDRADDGRLA